MLVEEDNMCEICNKNNILEKHHIWSRCYGGPNNNWNIAELCTNCHKMVHFGLLILEGRFTSCKGDILVWRKLGEKSITDVDDPKVWLYPNHKRLQEKYKQNIKNI